MGKGKDPSADLDETRGNLPLSKPAHTLTYEEVIKELEGKPQDGLTDQEAASRLEKYGKNDLGEEGGVNAVSILLNQVFNAMTLVLIMGMAVSFGIRSWIEGGVVAAIIFLNIAIGFWQEYKAEKTMDSLRSLSSPTAHAVRGSEAKVVPTVEIVPGDLVEVTMGDTIPADLRLIEAMNFETDEALLTGEALPVAKDAESTWDEVTGPGDRINLAYSSSTVTKGRARGIVFATGLNTQIGSIAASLRASKSRVRSPKLDKKGKARPHRKAQAWGLTFTDAVGRFLGVNVGTPLQKKLSRLALLLFGIAIVCAIIVLAANDFSSEQEVIIYAVATGLSMIPASLIVVLTITMAAGTKVMSKKNVIVRNLKSLEALGAVTDICSDKTGTLTQGKMVVRKAWIPASGVYSVEAGNEPFNPTLGTVSHEEAQPKDLPEKSEKEPQAREINELLEASSHLKDFLNVGSIANLSQVWQKDEDKSWHARGDPTETAIHVFASRFGWNRKTLTDETNGTWKPLTEFPFDSDVKKMSVLAKNNKTSEVKIFTKGAVERILSSCVNYYSSGSEQPSELTKEYETTILENMEALAAQGLRVLALASRDAPSGMENEKDIDRANVEKELTFRGLVGIYDPPRPESKTSVEECRRAGIEVHMLTGDHPQTAKAIAHEVKILPSKREMANMPKDVADAMVMTATQFDALSDDEIDKLPQLPLVIARCAPNTKVRMIDALHRRKKFCAMTGDGVNDSPSLKRADVGIAMGQAGSDVAKDASDIVLQDDNFASIVHAIEEGRRMFDNIQKFILHLLGQNVAQAIILLVGLVFKDSRGISVFPLAPVEVMWIIMITSSFPDMGLGFEKANPDVMRRPPVSLKKGVFSMEVLVDMLFYGLWIAALCLGSFTVVLHGFGDGELGDHCNTSYNDACELVYRARSTCFASLTWFSLFLAWQMIDMRRSFFRMQPHSKKYFTQWIYDVRRNKFLLISVCFGFITIFPVLYIPGLNRVVFNHTGITWEWGVVLVATLLFFAGIEAWKFGKRVFFRRYDKQRGQRIMDASDSDEEKGEASSASEEEKI